METENWGEVEKERGVEMKVGEVEAEKGEVGGGERGDVEEWLFGGEAGEAADSIATLSIDRLDKNDDASKYEENADCCELGLNDGVGERRETELVDPRNKATSR